MIAQVGRRDDVAVHAQIKYELAISLETAREEPGSKPAQRGSRWPTCRKRGPARLRCELQSLKVARGKLEQVQSPRYTNSAALCLELTFHPLGPAGQIANTDSTSPRQEFHRP